MKANLFSISILLCLALIMSSCMTTKTSVGAFDSTQGTEQLYARGKQYWLFWGVLPVGRTNVSTPADGNCQVVTRFTLVDFIISGITGGIVVTETIRVYTKKK